MRKLEKLLKYLLIEYPGTKVKKFLTRMTSIDRVSSLLKNSTLLVAIKTLLGLDLKAMAGI